MSTIVLTPNLTGRDGVSKLARLVVRARGADRVVALHEPAASVRFEGVEVHGAAGGSARFAAIALQQAARAGPGTTVIMVHLHLAPAGLMFAARGASLVTCLCGIEAWAPLSWPQRAALQRSQVVFAISRHTRERFAAANPRAAGRDIAVCHLGLEPALRAAAPDASPTALIVGRMARSERYKGHDALLDVWADVVRAVPAARLEIAGEGDDRARLEARAAALGVAGAVDFLGGLPDEERDRCYDRCAVLAMPSRDEGFGFVFLEAMRAGRACVAMHGSASEIVEDGRTGLLVRDARDRRALRDALVSVLGDPRRAADMGRRGRERFLSQFTAAHFGRRLAALLACGAPVGAPP